MELWTPQILLRLDMLALDQDDDQYRTYSFDGCIVYVETPGGSCLLESLWWDKEAEVWVMNYAGGDYCENFDGEPLKVYKYLMEPPSGMLYIINDVVWDDDAPDTLPTNDIHVVVEWEHLDNVEEHLSDSLSDHYGWTHKGFTFERG